MLDGAAERAEREQMQRGWLAWHIAALPRADRFPRLHSFLGIKRTERRQTPEEIEAIFRALAKG